MSAWVKGFTKSLGLIVASEIGDKTFIIAALMAMKHSRRLVFAGAFAAVALMTVLSAFLGWVAPTLLPKVAVHYAATALFFIFGIRLLYEAIFSKTEQISDEIEEVEREIAEKEGRRASSMGSDMANGIAHGADDNSKQPRKYRWGESLLPAILVEVFTVTFLAEWGDRSQISTIGLAIDYDMWSVTCGGVLGHALCTGAAVLGGRHLASHISERVVSIVGGMLFLGFGLHSLWEGVA